MVKRIAGSSREKVRIIAKMLLAKFLTSALLATTTIATPITTSISTNTTTFGPENGHLVIVGGNLQSDRIWQKIIDLAGGPNASIVVVPTAGGDSTYNSSFPAALSLSRLGANVTVLHTYDPLVADTDAFIAPLLSATGIFFGGGRQWRLVDAYAGTKTEAAFQSVLDRGGVISGSSAGASIIASFLARGDTANNTIMVGDHIVGFGYLKNAAIDQHVLVRNRHFDMFEILDYQPGLLGLAVDEDTALVVSGNTAEVFGRTYAIVYDGGFWSREGAGQGVELVGERKFYFLREGDRYDLKRREVVEVEEKERGEEW